MWHGFCGVQERQWFNWETDAWDLIVGKSTPAALGTPDYFGVTPNYAYSPIIKKFVDRLPGVGPANANNLGQFIPIAVSDTTTYLGSDYYQIGLVNYTQKLHTQLPATQLRGYRDLSPSADGKAHYLGPLIIAQRDRPVRLKFTNMLPITGTVGTNLFLPVDTTIMGAGAGPLDDGGAPCDPMNTTCANYPQNRAVIHLHGGLTPWISDGTPHQWITPAGDPSPFKKGVSFQNVPDMPDPGDGSATYYYPNQQSSRLMFYHDHAYGMTRLNVYAGEAAGYLLTDTVEEALISSKVLPDLGGVYHYGIPLIIQDKTFVPESFLDTPLVNGTAYPYLNVTRKAFRFRILNACNDRFLNLQLYLADPASTKEVKMVPARPHVGYPANWREGRGRARSAPRGSGDGPDRHRRRFPAGAGGAPQHSDRLCL